ncbi:MAG: DNA recombination protein RmuC [Ilumatobacter sp.]|uniref:DNA recombination protein RmuC n=1 Tax=Ilumatobacter sp. TaxID=1967498 RepID=UPI00262ADDCF|nr:DNA recombination protein RmuC [Ilumatobacter sp.]MDJ0769671.1 DNA recombination protein RmuC [Ilumatobacter sp.]
MNIVLVIVLLVVVGVAAALGAVEVTRRRFEASPATPDAPPVDEVVHEAVASALAEMREQSAAERDAAVQAALQQSAVLQREQLGSAARQAREQTSAELTAKKDVIDSRLDAVHAEMRSELTKLGSMVNTLAETSAQKFGQVDQSLRSHAEITQTLSDSARALREAMASPTARGQWGERMAEDVLRLAGFVENVNYVKQTQLDGASGRPDFTFPLPKGHELYMDVKFPMAGYLRFLDATTEAEQQAHRAAFVRDVRARVKELARRDYARESARTSVDYVLLFLPNEQLTGFIHEADPGLIDDAMNQRVVMCSPLTLFAFLGVIRQAYDNFVIEQTSDQILALIGKFGTQWQKYSEQLDKVKGKFDQLDRQFDELVGTRKRQLEKPLQQLESVRRERNLPIDGQLFPELDEGADPDVTPPNVRRLGA